MAEIRTAIAIGAAAATFAVGGVVAAGLSTDGSGSTTPLLETAPPALPEVGDFADDWHVQTAVASYESRLMRYAEQEASFTGARFALGSRTFILYGAGPPSDIVKHLLDAAPAEVHVTWVRVPYSRRELDRAVRRLRHAMPKGAVVEYAPNYGGVLVGLRPLPTSPTRHEALYRRAQRATDVPVTFLQAGSADSM